MDEILVSATDYLLAIECLVFTAILLTAKAAWPEMRRYFAIFFAGTAVASLAGGIYHGFFSTSVSNAGNLYWVAVMAALGLVACAGWAIGVCLLFVEPIVERLKSRLVRLAAFEFLIYFIYVAAARREFWVAIANYSPAVLFMIYAFAQTYRRRPGRLILAGLVGLGVTVLAAVIQRTSWSLELLHLNHNSTFHLVQAIGLFLIFRAALYFARTPPWTHGLGQTQKP